MRKIGKVRTRLAELISEALSKQEGYAIDVDPASFWIQEGAYRHLTWDLARWGADFQMLIPQGYNIDFQLHSWDTMTRCVQKGITLLRPRDYGMENLRCAQMTEHHCPEGKYIVQTLQARAPWGWTRHVKICRHDLKPVRLSWDQFQKLKNDVLGPNVNAVEFFPAEIDLVNELNMRHLWEVPDEWLPIRNR